MIKMYCDSCGEHVEFFIEPLTQDQRRPSNGIWGDILCKRHHVIINIKSDEEGIYNIVKYEAKND